MKKVNNSNFFLKHNRVTYTKKVQRQLEDGAKLSDIETIITPTNITSPMWLHEEFTNLILFCMTSNDMWSLM